MLLRRKCGKLRTVLPTLLPGFHPEIFLRGGKIRVLKMRWGGARQRAI